MYLVFCRILRCYIKFIYQGPTIGTSSYTRTPSHFFPYSLKCCQILFQDDSHNMAEFLMGIKKHFILHHQYHGCWCSDSLCSEDISNHGSDWQMHGSAEQWPYPRVKIWRHIDISLKYSAKTILVTMPTIKASASVIMTHRPNSALILINSVM